jgi:heat shock protein HtpX
MFKRIGLFLLTNIAVMITISIILNVLGVNHYITSQGLDYKSLLIFCGVWGLAGSFISLAMSKFMAKRMMGVEILDPNRRIGGKYEFLVSKVHGLSKAANLPKMPEVGIYDSPEVNAFATGPSKSNSLVAVSSGLLNNLSEDEIEGVLAHEVAHIANGDMVTMALVQGVINAFVMFFARIAAFAIQNALRSDDDDSPAGYGWSYYLTTIVFELLFGFIGMFIVSFFSRYREYRADSGGAALAGRHKMISALKKLQSQFENGIFEKGDAKMNAMKISSKSSGLYALLSTHPKLEDRIKALELNAK